ncbi:hypothetical protein S83_047010 [Arachis hypogaea]
METRRKEVEMLRLRYKGGLANIVGVDCEGEGKQRAGGLAVLWDEIINVMIRFMSINHIDMEVEIKESSQKWRATGFYGCPEQENKKLNLNLLNTLGKESDMAWMIFGDFNQIMG